MAENIVFMGTPDFAVPCLRRLLRDGYNVTGVFSQPDRPQGRGYKLTPPPVKQAALEHGIPVFQPAKMRDGEALAILRELKPDLAVVVAYGRILPPDLLAVPRLGCVNVHASLLPRLRGAAPIQWSVINGDRTTGVTTMFMAEGLDTGDMILTKETPIGSDETAGELFDRLSLLGADCLTETMPAVLAGTAPRTSQQEALATWAPPITKELAVLDFAGNGEALCNLIRGLNPAPSARTTLGGDLLKIHRAVFHSCSDTAPPGTVLSADPLLVACGGGALELTQVQPAGKKRMSGTDFARGKRLRGGEVLGACGAF